MYSPHGQTTCNHTEEDTHATYSQAKYEYITHVHIQAMTIKMNSDTCIMLKDNQDNTQTKESTHLVKWYITVNLYMQGD